MVNVSLSSLGIFALEIHQNNCSVVIAVCCKILAREELKLRTISLYHQRDQPNRALILNVWLVNVTLKRSKLSVTDDKSRKNLDITKRVSEPNRRGPSSGKVMSLYQ